MKCRRCGRDHPLDQFPLREVNPRSQTCVQCLRSDGLLDKLAVLGAIGSVEERAALLESARLSAEGRRVTEELEVERRPAIRELMSMRQMDEREAAAWTEAWLTAGKPILVEPFVFMAICRGVRYDAETQSIVEPPAA